MASVKRKKDWENFADKIKKKRAGQKRGDETGSNYITVQRLSATVEGKCQKYARIGALTMVPIESEHTLENIKAACKKHFNTEMECDLLAGERGPSYTDVGQIKNWKVLHVRFVEKATGIINHQVTKSFSPEESKETLSKMPAHDVSSSTVAASVPLSQMLKLGCLIVPKVEMVTLNLEEFSVAERQWQKPFEAKLSVNKNSFASGGFRNAFMATVLAGLPMGKYVLKRYKPERIPDIEQLFSSMEAHTRKAVQMNSLARNFAQNMQLERPVLEFGASFEYTKVYFTTYNGEPVTLENYLDGNGSFQKYVNNNGDITFPEDKATDISLKAETFAHFTFVRADKQLMVLDIQGKGYKLCDPEISTSVLTADEGEENQILFCSGNLSKMAIDNFFAKHKCNKYCKLMKLSEK